ncbi:MAG: hypothetical protein HFI17_19300 [Lachnospiraceae bacterium]|jgi:hypothetical protein|nr:hypothetical protein [Lachnospiraceae bacterium]
MRETSFELIYCGFDVGSFVAKNGVDNMNKIEREIFENYARDYKIESISYQILGMMLDEKYVVERLKMFGLNNIYIYGGTYMAIQLYRIGKKHIKIKGIVDKSGRMVLNEKVTVMLLDELKKKYENEFIIVTPLRYYSEIKRELEQFVDTTKIMDIGELFFGIA